MTQPISTDANALASAPIFGPVVSRGHDIPDVVRIALNSAALVIMWNYRWFVDLTDRSLLDAAGEGVLSTQAMFIGLGLAMGTAVARLGLARLRPLAHRPMKFFGAWLLLTAITSVDPALSLRRLAFFAVIALIAASILVIARSARQFALSLMISVAVVLGVSYLALIFAPHLAIHNAFDLGADPDHAGLWRGIFDGKNTAGAAMVLITFAGFYIASSLNGALGWTVVAAAFVFMLGSHSKTVLATLPLVLVMTSLCRATSNRWLRGLLLIGPVVLMMLVSIGSVLIPPIKSALDAFPIDSSFTGRRQIWEFTLSNIAVRPLQGWGFGAFWRTSHTLYTSDADTWVPAAAHAHNAYLDTALTLGIPGLFLLILVYIVVPLRDIDAIADQPAGIDGMTMFFMRIWFFGLLSASFESVFQNPYNSMCCMTFLSIFGLRLRASYRLLR